MEHHVPRYTRKPILAVVAAVTLLLAACGGKQSMASKSAAAYREAQAKGTSVGSEGHGDAHAGAPATATTASPHENHPQPDTTGEPPSAVGHDSPGATTRSGHPAGHEMAPPRSTHESEGHSSNGPPPTPDDSMQHGPAPARSDVDLKEQGSATARTQPAGTLRPDEFDAASPLSVSEAAKAGARGAQPMPRGETRPMDHSSHDQKAGKTTADRPPVATGYTCPMHPEVTSATPGACPKCGMTLVRKEKR